MLITNGGIAGLLFQLVETGFVTDNPRLGAAVLVSGILGIAANASSYTFGRSKVKAADSGPTIEVSTKETKEGNFNGVR